jgi:hypothetical protein
MGIDNTFGINGTRPDEATTDNLFLSLFSSFARHAARMWCGVHGHLILLHFEPNKLSLQCSLCGYETEGWEVGRPMTARRQANNPQARPDRRRTLRPLPTNARLAS